MYKGREHTVGNPDMKHPTLWIEGNEGNSLKGKKIVLAVTGSIAAVRVIELARALVRRGAKVYGVMSEAATHIIHPDALMYATGHPVCTTITGNVEHVLFFGSQGFADLLLIAPATANTISKIAVGIDDTAVTTFATTAIGEGKKIIVVPAMHASMYNHPKVRENLKTLYNWGVDIVGPVFEENVAKIAGNDEIVVRVERALHSASPLKGQKVLITSGSTAEKIDPVRIFTNRASGKTGEALALEAYRRGAEVYLFRRNDTPIPILKDENNFDKNFWDIRVESAADMTQAVLEHIDDEEALYTTGKTNILISAAAISDYTMPVEAYSYKKIKSGKSDMLIELVPTDKLIEQARCKSSELWIIAYKAETEQTNEKVLQYALKKFKETDIDMVIANNVRDQGMGTDFNKIWILKNKMLSEKEVGKMRAFEGSKQKLASDIFDEIEAMLQAEVKKIKQTKQTKKTQQKQNEEKMNKTASESKNNDVQITDIEPFTRRKYYEMGDGGAVFIPASKRRRKPVKMQGKTYSAFKKTDEKEK